jgi:hypothetical protein
MEFSILAAFPALGPSAAERISDLAPPGRFAILISFFRGEIPLGFLRISLVIGLDSFPILLPIVVSGGTYFCFNRKLLLPELYDCFG